MLPALTLSIAEFGSSATCERFCSTHVHVPGSTCITPRAFADETTALLNPLSCQATAAASEGERPCCAATCPTCDEVRRTGDGLGGAWGRVVGAGWGCAGAATWEPAGSFKAVP